jgi:putative Mn2+ efflux pump MntP
MGSLITIFIIAVSLALDAFAVSVAGGIRSQQSHWKDALKIGLYFGGFQAVMPLIGWVMGNSFRSLVMNASGWIAFVLLSIIGLKMIKEALFDNADDEDKEQKSLLNSRTLLLMAIATSIDALVVGITLSLIGLPLLVSVVIIGIITFGLSVFGFLFGKKLGSFFAGKIEIVGGIALIGIGLKLLLAS